MSIKNKTSKLRTFTSQKLNDENESESKTYLDSLYNSKLCQNEKENINKNIKLDIISEKESQKGKNQLSKNKEKNFYMALKTLNNEKKEIIESLNSSNESNNLLSRISEFSDANLNKSKDENVSKYLHHPIMKQITKLGNQIIKTNTCQAYKVNNNLEINEPLISNYNMGNIFEKFNNSFIAIENSNSNSKVYENQVNNIKYDNNYNVFEKKVEKNKNSKSRKKKLKYFHQKNKSSITNYYFTENNSTNTILNCNHNNTKNNKYVIHYKKNISSLIGGQRIINYKDRDSTTTYTKEELIKDLQIHEVNDINININIFNNNADRNLEVISDFDETKDNKNYNSTNKKNNNTSNKKEILIKNEYTSSIPKNIFNVEKKGKTSTESKKINSNISNNKDIDIVNLSHENNNKLKTFNKLDNYSGNKTLRKKYERTEFKFRYVDNLFESNLYNQNNYIMKNLINKFEQCSSMKDSKKNDNNANDNEFVKSNLNSENKMNETFIVKDSENGLILNLDVSLNNNSFLKNIQDNEITSISGKNENSKYSIKSALNSIKSYINKYNSIEKKENISVDKIPNNLSFNLNDSLNVRKIINCPKTTEYKNKKRKEFATPDRGNNDVKIHTFILDSPFDNNDTNALNSIRNSSIDKRQLNGNEVKDNYISKSKQKEEIKDEAQPQSVYDFNFYQKLLQAEKKMAKICKIFAKNEIILNTELRLEILLWMMKTCEEFAFKRDTYHNACYYFDMYLINTNNNNNKTYDKSELELIGLTCIVISAKIEEIQLPRLKEYAELLSNKYNIKSIIEMEKKICSSLSWKLIIITKNIWLSWYICQWDLFIDTIDNIKQDLLNVIKEDEILYYKKPNDSSYYNFRKISQLIDIMTLDFYSYNFEPRILIAASFFILLCHNYKLNYNFAKKKINNNSLLSDLLFNLYDKFITQSFDYNFNDDRIQKAIKYCYNYINFPFIFDLPLLYQVHQSKLDGDSYEDFLSYQTTNDNYFQVLKERININKIITKKSKKKISKENDFCHKRTNIAFEKK